MLQYTFSDYRTVVPSKIWRSRPPLVLWYAFESFRTCKWVLINWLSYHILIVFKICSVLYYNCNTWTVQDRKQETQLSLVWGRLHWLSLTFKVIQGRSIIFISSERAYVTSLVINSKLGCIHHRFRDMASFPLENAHFPTPRPFNPEFENVPFGVDHWNLHARV